tara:strand:+ start:633 stop:1355 length:723 start_codon:yes stop_codon:yes gene_type:complete
MKQYERPTHYGKIFRGAPGNEDGEKWFFNQIKEDIDVIYDVGASDNSIFVDFTGEVHYFEPTERIHALKKRANHNKKSHWNDFGLSNVTASDRDVTWETGGVIPLKDGSCKYTDSPEMTKMNAITGEDYLKEVGQETVDFLKIDTEGHELDIIKGFGERIKDVNIIQFEYSGINWAMNIGMMDLINHLQQYDFCNFAYAATGGLEEIDISNFEDHWHWCNVVCFQKDFLSKLTNRGTLMS